MNKAAQALGRMAAGKPKRFSAAEIARRTARIQKYNADRKIANGCTLIPPCPPT
jgi:hypothetical protein